jgi:hypothetical protein
VVKEQEEKAGQSKSMVKSKTFTEAWSSGSEIYNLLMKESENPGYSYRTRCRLSAYGGLREFGSNFCRCRWINRNSVRGELDFN